MDIIEHKGQQKDNKIQKLIFLFSYIISSAFLKASANVVLLPSQYAYPTDIPNISPYFGRSFAALCSKIREEAAPFVSTPIHSPITAIPITRLTAIISFLFFCETSQLLITSIMLIINVKSVINTTTVYKSDISFYLIAKLSDRNIVFANVMCQKCGNPNKRISEIFHRCLFVAA